MARLDLARRFLLNSINLSSLHLQVPKKISKDKLNIHKHLSILYFFNFTCQNKTCSCPLV